MRTYFGRRAAALALTAALLTVPVLAAPALSAGPEPPAGWTNPFPDVEEGSWYYPFVAALNSQGVVHGYDSGLFGTADPVRAGDSIIMVLKAAGCGDLEPLQDAHYAASYVLYAAEKGILTQREIPADLNGTASRLFIAQTAAKALELEPAVRDGRAGITAPSPFADVDDGYVTALYREGIVAGSVGEDGRRLFKPEDPITRAELSAIVWRIMEHAAGAQEEPERTPLQEPEEPQRPERPGDVIQFQDQTLDVLPGVPVNEYDPEAFALEDGRMTYSGRDASPALGIDVAYYQGDIDWERAAADGVEFAMIRLGGRYYGLDSGTVFEDSKFRAYMEGALDAGLEVGVYFSSQATCPEEAEEEADFALERLAEYDFDGPVVFDWENIDYDSARTDGMDAAAVTGAARAFCREVERAGYRPMIYFNRHIAYLLYELDKVDRWPFWIADYSAVPQFYYGFDMWQYTDKGTVDGIQGPVDMDLRLKDW